MLLSMLYVPTANEVSSKYKISSSDLNAEISPNPGL